MIDLIDRAAYCADMRERQEACKMCIDNAADEADRERWRSAYGVFVEAKLTLDKQPTVPAVPLDKLCEWLANSFSDPPCCVLENVRCKMECRGFTQMAYSECWRYVLTKWMEGLDGTD